MYAKILKANPYHGKDGKFASKDSAVPNVGGIHVADATMQQFHDALGIRVRQSNMSKFKAAQGSLHGDMGGKKPAAKKPAPAAASHVTVGGEDAYRFSNGKSPGGRGSWIFSPKKSIDWGTAKQGEDFYQSPHNTLYSDAKKQAKAWAASKGKSHINVMP